TRRGKSSWRLHSSMACRLPPFTTLLEDIWWADLPLGLLNRKFRGRQVLGNRNHRMAAVSFHEIKKNFGKTQLLHGISLDIADGEFMVLVGPSGCGKSTLLRMLAGLEDISGGVIAIEGRTVNDLDSKDRDVAMVFQSYALYPHMTVKENMGFS